MIDDDDGGGDGVFCTAFIQRVNVLDFTTATATAPVGLHVGAVELLIQFKKAKAGVEIKEAK